MEELIVITSITYPLIAHNGYFFHRQAHKNSPINLQDSWKDAGLSDDVDAYLI